MRGASRYAGWVLMLFMLGSGGTVRAATVTWTGGGADNNWSTALNWSGGALPGAADNVVFDGTSTKACTVDVAVNVGGVDVQAGYTGTLTQLAGVSLNIGTVGYSQAGGVFSGSNANLDINGSFTLTAGSFTTTTGTMSVARNFTIAAFSPFLWVRSRLALFHARGVFIAAPPKGFGPLLAL